MLKSLKWLLGGAVLILITLGITQAVKDTRAFNELKLSDPEQYLAILKEKDETQWLVALKDLNSEQYAAELKARVEIARKIPASKIDENLKAYRDLAKLEPSNETFADKVEFYKSKKTAIEGLVTLSPLTLVSPNQRFTPSQLWSQYSILLGLCV